ncbi:glycogen/starch/alpha-glucan family phosphorylase [uncultured Intestinimonas sp.]|uniref:glycogen/starch/alpha-glucan family phosphorylase n=1 Tax=uncultured Intestinimonas sp. TaxID=1689265 RepID=UPI0025F49E1C|nr:glycogen/starch/alpha-glucan family phosphorylase [uncultured Intestinimonas sp.]
MSTKYTKKELEEQIIGKLRRNFGREVEEATSVHMFRACALVLRDIMSARELATQSRIRDSHARQVHYLSLEFLMGRSLEKNAYNLGVLPQLKEAIEDLGFSAPDLFEVEPDAGLGNGGLGRLAACYLESMTTLEIPATGYSICYELGLFKQKIVDGQQVELPDNWLDISDCWLIPKMDETEKVHFGGTVKDVWGPDGSHSVVYEGGNDVLAVPKDMEIAGYGTDHVNVLRLWDAKSPTPLDMSLFSRGEYLKATEQKAMAESIAKVLYPEDNHYEGKSLRLKQQYFFVSATVQSICRQHKAEYGTLRNFHQKHVIQINDTHPTLVIPELMRILLDEEGYTWDEAWHIVTNTVAYTNHTIMVEALERWPQQLIESLLPRIWQILVEISNRYQAQLNEYFHGDQSKVRDQAIIWGGEVRMANLCVCACFAVNGVSALHSEILKRETFHDVYVRTPEKFKNVTNGIDHRRWLSEINPKLDALIQDCGGKGYQLHPEQLECLLKHQDDASVLERLAAIKAENKRNFAAYVARESGVVLNTDAMFDVQVKRLHEYKRQLLNVMHITYLYQQLKNDAHFDFTPRTYLFGAKAAPGYSVAKDIIHLINSLAQAVNSDPVCKDRLQVVFLENYRVSLAEKLMPASELSEQISTAGKEASGTGNMKFMMNGALTIGTLDGANVEMHQQVGDENIFLFGLKAHEVAEKKSKGYRAYEYYMRDGLLKSVLDQITQGFGDGVSYSDITNRLLFGANGGMADEYMLLADFESYREAHERAGRTYLDPKQWNKMALINIAKSGIFAADRSIRDYARDIWKVPAKQG